MRAAQAALTGPVRATAALALAAGSTGVIVPALRPLVEHAGAGPTAAGVFVAAHVVGGALGAGLGPRALRAIGSARRLATAGLAASVALTAAIAAIEPLGVRIALRVLDGGAHLLAITALVAIATSGDAEQRARRAVAMGLAIMLGVAAGVGVGAALARPVAALVVSALLSAASLVVSRSLPVAVPSPAPPRRGAIAPGLLAFGERFLFGALSVAAPFRAPPRRVGLVIGVAMTAAVIALPIARRLAGRWGARRLAVRAMLGLAAALAVAGATDVFADPGLAALWATGVGAAAGALYAAALVLVARSATLDRRVADMGSVHAGGSAGFALGALVAGALVDSLPGGLVIAAPSGAVLLGVVTWLVIARPDAVRDCPVIGDPATRELPIGELSR